MKKIYFAYGANTNKEAMRRRCPNARAIGAGHLNDFRLKFNNVADIDKFTYPEIESAWYSEAPVVIWEITPDCEKALDRFESFPSLYRKIEVDGYIHEKNTNGDYFKHYQGFAYKMNWSGLNIPNASYVHTIREGLKGFHPKSNWDYIDKMIDEAILESFKASEESLNSHRKYGGSNWR